MQWSRTKIDAVLELKSLTCSSESESMISQSAPCLEDKSGPASWGKISPSREDSRPRSSRALHNKKSSWEAYRGQHWEDIDEIYVSKWSPSSRSPSSPASDLCPGAGNLTAALRKRLSMMKEEIDRTDFVAAGGNLSCLWKKAKFSKQIGRI